MQDHDGANGPPAPTGGFAERVASWVDSAADAVACVDPALVVLYVNRSWCALTGADAATWLGRPLTGSRPFGAGTDEVAAMIRRVAEHGERIEGDVAASPDAMLAVSVRPDVDPDGSIAGYVVAVRDVTSLKAVERALHDRETDFRTLAENSPDNIIRFGLDGRATYCNPEFARRLGVEPSRVVGRRMTESTSHDIELMAEYDRLVRRAITTGEGGQLEMVIRTPSGVDQIHSILVRAELDTQGEIRGALAIGRDVTEMVHARQAIAEKEREFRSLAENATDNIGRWDTDGNLVYANPALVELSGGPLEAVRGRRDDDSAVGRFADVAAAVDRVLRTGEGETVETRFNHPADGVEHVHLVRLVPEHGLDGALVSVLGVGRDITDLVRQREDLEHMARTDALTGCANRQLLYERSTDLFTDASVRDVGLGLMLLDLDGFKNINDRLGHRAGDDLLRIVSQRLGACLRDRDLLVRLGGDEFVIVVSHVHARDDLTALAHRVRLALAEITAADGAHFARVDASIGIALYPDDGLTMDVLLARADLAMYQAKRNGRGRVEHFRPELAAAMERRAAIEQTLMTGDFGSGFDLHLQPVFRLAEPMTVVGAEALARWTHPVLGGVAPDEFIPVAEECGRIVQLGRWALRRAAEAAVRLNRDRPAPLHVAVNVSTRQFALDDVVAALQEAIAVTGCDPAWLTVEITESLLLDDSASVHTTLEALRGHGVAIAIDDFGMGYSALHYLSRFPVDDIKIDRAFVAGIGDGARRTELVRAFVALADALALDVVAEGIETEEQLGFLRRIGCRHGQGYLLGRPMPIDDFVAFERAHRHSPVL